MRELKIYEVILRERKKKNMTQEALAEALGVSAQAVSNWERGGYPDITMLPAIANFFEISVDELMGNDMKSQELDESELFYAYREIEDVRGQIEFATQYYRKYPKNYRIAIFVSNLIRDLPQDERKRFLPLLREITERIISECPGGWYRQNAIRNMCAVCSDDEYEKWYAMCPESYSAIREEVFEERLWVQGKWDESRLWFDKNNLNILLHFMSRKDRNLGSPERATAWNHALIGIIDSLKINREIPPAWLGKYADLHFGAACSSFGMGKIEEGYDLLEKSFVLHEKWFEIPCGTPLDVGDAVLFGGIKAVKGKGCVLLPDGRYESHLCFDPAFWLEERNSLYYALTCKNREWFDGVRNEDRFKVYVERAKSFCPENGLY